MNEFNLLPASGHHTEIPKIRFEDIDTKKPKRLKRTKPKRKVFKRLLSLVLIGFIAFSVYKYFPNIKSYFESHLNTGDTGAQTIPPLAETGTGSLSGNSQPSLPEDSKPSKFPIVSSPPKSFEVINKSTHNIEFSDTSATFLSASDIYKRYGSDAPVILITHLFPTESYSNGESYLPSDDFYSTYKNVGELGKEICASLCYDGVNAIHLNKTYNEGTLSGSRKEFEHEVDRILKRYPSIAYVLDISRSIYINADMTVERPSYNTENGSSAQVSITVGTGGDAISDDQRENLMFATELCELLLTENKHSVSNLTISPFTISQSISPIFIKVNIGEYGNTFDEALASTKALSKAVTKLIK